MESLFCRIAFLADRCPGEIAGRFVGVFQSLESPLQSSGHGSRGFRRTGPFGRNLKNPAPLEVAHGVTTNTGIIPIGHIERAVRSHADITGSEPAVPGSLEQVHHFRLVACPFGLDRIGPHHAWSGVAMNDLAAENLGQGFAFINTNARGRAGSGLEQIGDHPRVVLVPVLERDLRLHADPRLPPARTGDFVGVAVVAVLHHLVDADPLVAIVIVVALPKTAKGVDVDFPVVAEIPAQHFQIGPVQLTAEDHALAVGAIVFIGAFDPMDVGDEVAILVTEPLPGVAEVEIQTPVGSEMERVDAVVVLLAPDAGEQQLLAVTPTVAVVIVEREHFLPGTNDDTVAEHANAVGRVDIGALMEDRDPIRFAITILVLQNEDAVALPALAKMPPVVDDLANPDPSTGIDIDRRRAQNHGFGSKEPGLKIRVHLKVGHSLRRIMAPIGRRSRLRFVGREPATWGFVKHQKPNAGRRIPALLGKATVIQSAPGDKTPDAFRQLVVQQRVGMHADPVSGFLAIDLLFTAAHIVDPADPAPVGSGFLPIQISQLHFLAVRQNETRFRPVAPVARK